MFHSLGTQSISMHNAQCQTHSSGLAAVAMLQRRSEKLPHSIFSNRDTCRFSFVMGDVDPPGKTHNGTQGGDIKQRLSVT